MTEASALKATLVKLRNDTGEAVSSRPPLRKLAARPMTDVAKAK
jgi:hypothetical protein